MPARDRVNLAFGRQYTESPGYPGRGPVDDLDGYRTADQRAVEAMLVGVRAPCTAQQLARGLGWTLPRTDDALQQLEGSLANTGQTLARLGHHSYTLGPRPGLLTDREIARCLRHNREPLDSLPPRCCTARSPVRGRTMPVTRSPTPRKTRPPNG